MLLVTAEGRSVILGLGRHVFRRQEEGNLCGCSFRILCALTESDSQIVNVWLDVNKNPEGVLQLEPKYDRVNTKQGEENKEK